MVRYFIGTTALLLTAFAGIDLSQAATVSLHAPTSVLPGDSFTVEVRLSDDLTGVYGLQAGLTYDPAVLSLLPNQEPTAAHGFFDGTAGNVFPGESIPKDADLFHLNTALPGQVLLGYVKNTSDPAGSPYKTIPDTAAHLVFSTAAEYTGQTTLTLAPYTVNGISVPPVILAARDGSAVTANAGSPLVIRISDPLSIPLGAPDVYSIDDLGASPTASLPVTWKIDTVQTARTVGDYSTASLTTDFPGGPGMTPVSEPGAYNLGSGATPTGPDRALGWLAEDEAFKSGNLYAYLRNDTGVDLTGIVLSYDIEKYRNGSNAAGFSVQLFYSTDGMTWSNAGLNFLNSFPPDGNDNGFPMAPGSITSVIEKQLSVVIPAGQDFYLAWNYSVTSGDTVAHAQCLGLDNIRILGRPLRVSGGSTSAVKSSPVSFDGYVFFGNNAGQMRRVDTATGVESWLFNTRVNGLPVTRQTLGRPALNIIDGVRYLFFTTSDAYVFCVNADTGDDVWSVGPLLSDATLVDTTPAAITGSTLAGTTVYVSAFTANEGRVFALRGDDGSEAILPSVNLITTSTFGNKLSSPAAGSGGVYVSVIGGSSAGYRLNTGTLAVMVYLADGRNAGTPPYIYQYSGVVYPRVLISATDGSLTAFNATNGTREFENVPIASAILTFPVAFGNVVYMGGSDGVVYQANAADGAAPGGKRVLYSGASPYTILGLTMDPAGIGSAPTLVFGDAGGRFHRVPIADPTKAVVINVPGMSPYATTPTIDQVNAMVQIGNDDNNVYSFMRH